MVRKLRKTLALSLAVLGMTSTLALAQPRNTTANTGMGTSTEMAGRADTSATSAADSQDPYWNQSWNYVGSGAAIPAHSLAVSSLNGDRLIYERFAHPFGPEAGQIVSKTDTM